MFAGSISGSVGLQVYDDVNIYVFNSFSNSVCAAFMLR